MNENGQSNRIHPFAFKRIKKVSMVDWIGLDRIIKYLIGNHSNKIPQ